MLGEGGYGEELGREEGERRNKKNSNKNVFCTSCVGVTKNWALTVIFIG